MPAGVPVIPVGAERIVPRLPVRPVAITELGTIVADFVTAIPAGAATIVQLKMLVAGMEHGYHGIITIPAGVTVISTGAAVIVP